MTVTKIDLEALNYDDVMLLPQWSDINSRDDIDLFYYEKTRPYIPIFSSPMKGISEDDLVIEINKKGGVGFLHRFFNTKEGWYNSIDKIAYEVDSFGAAIGLNNWKEQLDFVGYSQNQGCRFIVIDVASGYLEKTIGAVRSLYEFRKNKKLEFDIIAGNVVDLSGCYYLAESGADMIRVGIGGGSLCKTTTKIGIGCPSLTSIADCSKIKEKFPNVKIIADGGIDNSGRALKAFVFGADVVMCGYLFGHSLECHNDGLVYGMSSTLLQEKMGKIKKSDEGYVVVIPEDEIKPFKGIWNEFTYGLKSGLSYLGCKSLQNLHNIEVEYIKVK